MRLPKLLIAHEKKNKAGFWAVCRHYLGNLSQEYLNKTFDNFSDPDGITLILNVTSGAGEV